MRRSETVGSWVMQHSGCHWEPLGFEFIHLQCWAPAPGDPGDPVRLPGGILHRGAYHCGHESTWSVVALTQHSTAGGEGVPHGIIPMGASDSKEVDMMILRKVFFLV